MFVDADFDSAWLNSIVVIFVLLVSNCAGRGYYILRRLEDFGGGWVWYVLCILVVIFVFYGYLLLDVGSLNWLLEMVKFTCCMWAGWDYLICVVLKGLMLCRCNSVSDLMCLSTNAITLLRW